MKPDISSCIENRCGTYPSDLAAARRGKDFPYDLSPNFHALKENHGKFALWGRALLLWLRSR